MGCNQSIGKIYNTEEEFSYAHEFEMYAAIVSGSLKKVSNLLSQGFGINYLMLRFCFRSCLHISAEYGQVEIFSYLLSVGANINQKDRDGLVPIFIACSQGHLKIVEICFQKNAKTNTTSKFNLKLKDYVPSALEKQFRHLLVTYNITSVYQRSGFQENSSIFSPKA